MIKHLDISQIIQKPYRKKVLHKFLWVITSKKSPDADLTLKLRTDASWVWHNRAIALGKVERHTEALNSFDRALEFDPNQALFGTIAVLPCATAVRMTRQ